MPENIPDFIQSLLDMHGGFMRVKDLPEFMSFDMIRQLKLKRNASIGSIRKALEPVLGDRFVFMKKGTAVFLIIPLEPSEFVIRALGDSPVGPKAIAKGLPFMTKKDIRDIVNALTESGRVRLILNDELDPRIILCDGELESDSEPESESDEYTRERFREAFDSCNKGRIFVRIPDLRRALAWPRDVFDSMLKTLRYEGVISLHTGDASLMTRDEVEDCYIDEHGFRLGSVTWNVRE